MTSLQNTFVIVALCACVALQRGVEGQTWIPTDRSSECPSNPSMDNDVLGRRRSGLLARPSDQGWCGSCWAVSSTHTFTDRRSISMGMKTSLLSSQDLTECIDIQNNEGSGRLNGCCGSTAVEAFDYFKRIGIVENQCKPYRLTNFNKPDDSQSLPPLDCSTQCTNMNDAYNPSTHRLSGQKRLLSQQVIDELSQNGPIIARMVVADDFFGYACGIYVYNGVSDIAGSHSVEIVDYGTENGMDYWVVKNSWGENFGERGYFRIRRGQNDLQIETRGLYAPLLIGSGTVDTATGLDCAPEAVATNDADVQSVANFAVDSLEGTISCSSSGSSPRPGSMSADFTVESIVSATCQIVAGEIFEVVLNAKIEGCSDEAYIFARVYARLNGTFELIRYQYFPDSLPSYLEPDVATTISACGWLLSIIVFLAMLLF